MGSLQPSTHLMCGFKCASSLNPLLVISKRCQSESERSSGMLKENKVRTCSIIYVHIYIYNYI